MSTRDWEAIEQDKETKKQLVLQTLQERCTPNSKVSEFRKFSEKPLDIAILTGGLTNYSYKISLESDPTICVFAKLSFEYALWSNENSHYDLVRTENEYHMMEVFHKLAPGCIATPYLCVDVGSDMKLIVTEWAAADEQFANQFIDGVVDKRAVIHLGHALAKLHLMDFDPDFNANVMEVCQTTFLSIKSEVVDKLLDAKDETPATVLANELGKDDLYSFVDQLAASMANNKECLSHSDSHVFNLLVEAKPDTSTLEEFGPNGTLFIVDWEMCHGAPMGKDLGIFWAFPIASMLCHAMNGDQEAVENIWDSVRAMMDAYGTTMMKEGLKNEEGLAKVYRTALGWTGTFLSLYYGFDFHIDQLPIDSDKDRKLFKGHLGKLALLFLNWGFGEGIAIDFNNLPRHFEEAVRSEISLLTVAKAVSKRVGPRRSSMLRISGRRISDAGLHFGDKTRLSLTADGIADAMFVEEK